LPERQECENWTVATKPEMNGRLGNRPLRVMSACCALRQFEHDTSSVAMGSILPSDSFARMTALSGFADAAGINSSEPGRGLGRYQYAGLDIIIRHNLQ
jgi:hypothetical protein